MVVSHYKIVFCVMLTLLLGLLHVSAEEIDRTVTIYFTEIPNADFYHIEWLIKKPSPEDKTPEKERYIEKVMQSPIHKQLPIRYNYFRMRTAAGGYYSRWGEPILLEKQVEKITIKADESDNNLLTQKNDDAKSDQQKDKNSTDKNNTQGKDTKTVTDNKDKTDNKSQTLTNGIKPPEQQLAGVDVGCCFRKITVNDREVLILKKDTLPLDGLTTQKPLYYSVDRGKVHPYTSPLTFTKDGDYRVDLFSGDKRREKVSSVFFIVDTSPPITTPGLYQPVIHDGGQLWVTGTSKIELTAEDLTSGVAQVYYRILLANKPQVEFQKYQGAFTPLPALDQMESDISLEFFAEDNNGNREAVKKVTIHVDTLGPRVKVAVDGVPKGYHRLIFDEHSTPVNVEIFNSAGKSVLKAETREMLQFKKLPAENYKAIMTDNFGNRSEQSFNLQ